MAKLCRQWRRSPLLRPSSELPLAPWGPLGSFEVAPGQTEWQSVKSWCGERRGEWMRMEGFLPRANEEIFKDVKSVKKVLATSDLAFKTSERGDNTWQYSNSKKRNGFFGSPKSQFKSLYLWPWLTCNARTTCRGVSTCQCTNATTMARHAPMHRTSTVWRFFSSCDRRSAARRSAFIFEYHAV